MAWDFLCQPPLAWGWVATGCPCVSLCLFFATPSPPPACWRSVYVCGCSSVFFYPQNSQTIVIKQQGLPGSRVLVSCWAPMSLGVRWWGGEEEGALPSCLCSPPASQLGLGTPAPLSPWLHRSGQRCTGRASSVMSRLQLFQSWRLSQLSTPRILDYVLGRVLGFLTLMGKSKVLSHGPRLSSVQGMACKGG